jgi:hypothetical protein
MNSNLISLWRSDVVVRFFISRVAPPKGGGYRLAVLSTEMTLSIDPGQTGTAPGP